MALQPIDDRVVVEIEAAEAKTQGGIVLPETAKEKPQRGKIVAVGNGKLLANGERVACSLSEGDRVIFGKYSGTEVKYGGSEYKILKEGDILAKLG
ncbi:co-chaperone GroES [Candidatus Uabimicrobium amorphum]|uniref:Co-chaperonin GroES n=1 Tax=Uabimicrobium amorphum TaxID=2596890 RepID=A0A5S9F2N3_UABAM|nr:co-chaperone GroES [Candidatus Uabimicrobium amorphum]BBM83857.1 10 kDa chaperonin [Candidatus Uabimicrobium amorphum]